MNKRRERRGVFTAFLGLAAALLGLATLGCGGGSGGSAPSDAAPADTTADTSLPSVDIAGWYQVTSYTLGPCGASTPVSFGPAYVWVERRMKTFIFNACSGSTEADCTGTLFYDFTQPIESGWQAEGGSSFYSAGCTLTWERTRATLEGSTLRAQGLRFSVHDDRAESACTLSAATELTDPCASETNLLASRI